MSFPLSPTKALGGSGGPSDDAPLPRELHPDVRYGYISPEASAQLSSTPHRCPLHSACSFVLVS